MRLLSPLFICRRKEPQPRRAERAGRKRETEGKMIRKLIRQMLAAQTLSALTVSLCLLIDNIMIGRFLGVNAIAAYGLANPILLVIGAFGSMLAAGVQVACSKSLGSGSQEETNRGYSSALALAAAVSLLLTAGVLIFRNPLATAMGAGREGEIYDMTRDYLAGFIIGAPGSMGALVLVPFLQMAGKSGLLIAAVLGMTVADVVLDLLNVLVFHGGMFGMGLASSLSYYVAMVIAAFYFLSGKCVFRFSRGYVSRKKIAELMTGGVPTVFTMASSVVLVFILNRILLGTGGSDAVAAYSVLLTIGNACNCISTGVGGVSLTLSGIFHGEEDVSGLKELLKLLSRYGVLLGAAVGAMLIVFAPVLTGIFIPEEGAAKELTIQGLRLFALGLIPCCINNTLKNLYQGTGRVALTEGISVLEGAVFPALAALVLGRLFGVTGVWLYFLCGEVLALLFSLLGVFGIIVSSVAWIVFVVLALVITIRKCMRLSHAFGQTDTFGLLGLFLFSDIGRLILSWGQCTYTAPAQRVDEQGNVIDQSGTMITGIFKDIKAGHAIDL